MTEPALIVRYVLSETALQEPDWLEWKSQADLGERLWQARVARFILGAANRPRASFAGPHDGSGFLLLGVEPSQVHGTPVVDSAVVRQGLGRYLGDVGPPYNLDYVTIEGRAVAVVTVPASAPGTRPYLARGSFSGSKLEIQDGRIYIRRPGLTTEASASEIDDMLADRVAARVAAGPLWPMQAEPAWRDGNTIHVRQGHGDIVHVHGPDTFTNLAEMAAMRPPIPDSLPDEIAQRVAVFDRFLAVADSDPYRAVEESWAPLRALTVEVYEQFVGPRPIPGYKVVDMVTDLANRGIVKPARWLDVAYPLYCWPIDQSPETLAANPGAAKTYVSLAKSLGAALLLAQERAKEEGAQFRDA